MTMTYDNTTLVELENIWNANGDGIERTFGIVFDSFREEIRLTKEKDW